MAELGLSTASSSDTVTELPMNDEESLEPSSKKPKIERFPPESVDLEDRLNSILCCTVCLDLPNVAMYQVKQFI